MGFVGSPIEGLVLFALTMSLGFHKLGFKSLCSLISWYKKEFNRVSWNYMELSVHFFKRIYDIRK